MNRLSMGLLVLLTASTGRAQTYRQLTDVPTIYIETQDKRDITSKENYVTCKLTYVDQTGTTTYTDTQVRGRGNSSWWNSPKKPYRIKFAKKQRLLGAGFANAKSWTLLANHGDKTLMRNALTYDLGRFMGMPFCPAARFVDLYVNGNYRGAYQLSDQVQVHKGRINIDEADGWLLEVGNTNSREEPCFTTTRGILYNIKNPDDENFNAQKRADITQWVKKLEDLIFSTGFNDPQTGYRAYIDEDDLVNWYVGAEITGNIDALYSIYMYKDKDEQKLHFGPLWDLDLGYDNSSQRSLQRNMEAYLYLDDRPFEKVMRRLWQDPWFASACTERLQSLIDAGLEDYLLGHIDSLRNAVYQSQERNFRVWSINQQVYSWEKHTYHNTYDEYVADLKSFVSTHLSYLQDAFGRRLAAHIESPESSPAPATRYDLQGRPAPDDRRGGLYIENGKAVIKKRK